MLSWFLLALGILWLFLGISKTTGFSNNLGRFVVDAVAIMFFIFGMFHIAIAVFLMIAPTPFGQVINQTISSNTTFTYQLVNTTTFNSTGGNTTVGNIFVNASTGNKTVSYSYNVFGDGLLTFLSYSYFLMVFIYLFLFSWDLFKKANKPLGRDNDDES